jgi:hypothetical protein
VRVENDQLFIQAKRHEDTDHTTFRKTLIRRLELPANVDNRRYTFVRPVLSLARAVAHSNSLRAIHVALQLFINRHENTLNDDVKIVCNND